MARTFLDRFRSHWLCVLPAEVLSDDPLVDPDTQETLPSLRTQASAQGLCFARVLRAFAHGLYWADVSATSEASAPTTRVLLTEEDLG